MSKKHARGARRESRRRTRPADPRPSIVHPGGLYATVVTKAPLDADGPPILQILTMPVIDTIELIEHVARETLNRWGAGVKDATRGAINGTWVDGGLYFFAPPAVFEASRAMNLIRELRAAGVTGSDRDRVMMTLGALGERLFVRQNEHLAATGRKVHKGTAAATEVQYGPTVQREAKRRGIVGKCRELRDEHPEWSQGAIDAEAGKQFTPRLSARQVRRIRTNHA